jgi:hypothetical protein
MRNPYPRYQTRKIFYRDEGSQELSRWPLDAGFWMAEAANLIK